MRLALLSTTLLALAPTAQAQSWTQLLGDLPGYSAALATHQALHVDEQGGIHVQTAQNAAGSRVGRLYALNSSGVPLPGLSTNVTLAAVTTARAVDARSGYRLSWYEYGAQPLIYFYDPGMAVHDRALSFGQGVELKLLASDGNDGALIVYADAGIPGKPRVALFGANPFIRWSHLVGGCPSNDFLPVKVLAAEYATTPVPHVAIVSRCDATAAQGGGQVTLKYVDAVTGATLSTQTGWPYPDSADPVVAAYAVGGNRFLIEQADPASGDRHVRVIDINGQDTPLPMPPNFRLQAPARSGDAVLIPTQDDVRKNIGLLQFGPDKADWIEYGELGALARSELSWGVSSDGSGAGAVAYKLPQADQRGPVLIYTFDGNGRVTARREAVTLPTRPQGRIELRGAGRAELLLAVDVERPDGRGAVHLEQFSLEGDIGTIPVGGIALPTRP